MVEQFVNLVKRYVELIEQITDRTTVEFLTECVAILPQLYALGHFLDCAYPENVIEQEEEIQIVSPIISIQQIMGRYDWYYEVIDPIYDKEAVANILSDDLADIYLDLKRPLIKYEKGNKQIQEIAIWEWKFCIEKHCGEHIVDALRPIHRLVNYHLDPAYKGESDD